MTVRWLAFPLHPETPENGRTLEDLFAGRAMDIPAMLAQLKMTAVQLGLPFGERNMTYNSRQAQEMGKWAEDKGRGDAFHQQVFRAYFVHGRNIARPEVLKKIADSSGLDGDEGIALLQAGQYRQAVDDDWQRSRQAGIRAVPTFHIDGRTLTGAQPYEAIRDFMLRH